MAKAWNSAIYIVYIFKRQEINRFLSVCDTGSGDIWHVSQKATDTRDRLLWIYHDFRYFSFFTLHVLGTRYPANKYLIRTYFLFVSLVTFRMHL